MTLEKPEAAESTMKQYTFRKNRCELVKTDMRSVLHQALISAQAEQRLIIGVEECSRLFELSATMPMLCVSLEPTKCDSPTEHMFLLMIEACCTTNQVPMIKMDQSGIDSAKSLLSIKEATDDDFACMLIQMPRENPSDAEKLLMRLVNDSGFFFPSPPSPD